MSRLVAESSLVILADLMSEYRARPALISGVASRLAAGRHKTIFLAMGSPYSAHGLRQLYTPNVTAEVAEAVRELRQEYEDSGRAFQIYEIAGGYQLMTRPALADWLRRMDRLPAEVRLSTPASSTWNAARSCPTCPP